VLVELPAYAGAITAFRNVQARLVGVRQEPDGIDLEHLDRVVGRERSAGARVAGLYVTPNFQNPTGLLMSQAKRRRLLEWAANRDVLIIEDDPYGEIYFDDEQGPTETRPLKADDADGRVAYLSTVSKTLAPGLRVAWVAAHPAVASKVEMVKQATDLCTGVLDQRIVHEALSQNIVSERLPELRRRYREKRDAMERAIAMELGSLLQWRPARGGFFLWATLPDGFDADRLLTRALAARVSYVTGSAFFVDELDPRLIRLSFSAPGVARIEEGVRRLASAIRDEMAVIASSSP
jgi:2-aminoadipate transaminase